MIPHCSVSALFLGIHLPIPQLLFDARVLHPFASFFLYKTSIC
nr:MAG TPA: hypothetical protein [Caudoviricetes sp.]